jgi:integrative and conjugative element protein (TIGR02256 family)
MTIELINEVLWLPQQLIEAEVAKDIVEHYPNEAGGMLLGYVNGTHRVVTALIGAGPGAKHGKYYMVPDDHYQQEKLLEHFERTDGRESFLGEWHSHPEASPRMSRTDRRTLHNVTIKSENLAALPVMMIAGVYARDRRCVLKAYRRRDALRHVWLKESVFLEISVERFMTEQMLIGCEPA